MFKTLGSALEKRRQKYGLQETIQRDAVSLIFNTLSQPVKNLIKPEDIRYDNIKKDVIFVARHRAIANEIALRLDEIYQCANKSGISFSRVLIAME